nr:hypothetical protein GCM10017745_17900 [Saccharothrix mutabilis subsp. capreolus]
MIVNQPPASAHQPECNCGAAVGEYHQAWCDALKAPADRTGQEG